MKRNEQLLELFTEPVIVGATYKDEEGRTLAEMNATRKLNEGVELTLRECSYEGSRQGKLMNVSGLKQLTEHHRMIVRDTHAMRTRYLGLHGATEMNLGLLWSFSRALSSVPVFAVRQCGTEVEPLNVPAPYSAMFKIAQGLHMAAEQMIFSGRDPARSIEPEEVVEFVEERGLFLSADGTRACAGPLPLVLDFIRAAIHGTGDDREVPFGVLELIGQDDAWASYADAITQIVLAKALQEVEGRLAVAALGERLADAGYDKVAKRCLARFGYFREVPARDLEGLTVGLRQLSTTSHGGFGARYELDPRELSRHLRDGSQGLTEESSEQVALHLGLELSRERDWLEALQALQTRVLSALGHGFEAPCLSSRDFRGHGHNLREVVSAWLGVGIDNSEKGVALKLEGGVVELTP